MMRRKCKKLLLEYDFAKRGASPPPPPSSTEGVSSPSPFPPPSSKGGAVSSRTSSARNLNMQAPSSFQCHVRKIINIFTVHTFLARKLLSIMNCPINVSPSMQKKDQLIFLTTEHNLIKK